MVQPAWHAATLSRMQQELDFHRFERKNDAPVVGAIEDSSIEQCGNIAMNGLHITTNPPRSFAD